MGFSQTRYKAKLAVRPPGEIGLFKKNTHQVLSIPNCLVHHSAINQAVAIIKKEIENHRIPLYTESPPSGLLRYLQFFVDKETSKIQLGLILRADRSPPQIEAFCESLLKHPLWHSIWFNYHPDASNRVHGPTWERFHGELFLWQTLQNTTVAFHPGAFSQTHLPLFEVLLQTIDTWIQPHRRIVEFYAGVGVIGLSLRSKAKEIHLIENNPFAHLSFQETIQRLPSLPIFYHSSDANHALSLIDEGDFVIVDPPRKGIDASLLSHLCNHKGSLLYISCNFHSFQRDAEMLIQAGWKMKKAEGFLLFPGTNHVEIAAYFERP